MSADKNSNNSFQQFICIDMPADKNSYSVV